MVPNELHSPMVYGVRSLVPLAIGLTFGVLISLVIFPQDEYTIPNGSCSIAQQPEALKIVDDSSADWQVVVKKIPSSAHRAQSNAAKVVRARFAATELGIREKLLVIILGQSSLSIALNASIAHHLPHLQIFIDVSRIDSDMASLPNLIQYRSNSQHPHVTILNHIFNMTLHENYDWFYLMPDTTYVNPFELLHFVNHINWNRKVAIGGSLTNDNKCTLQAGILLSNPAMQSLIQQRHICNSIVSSSDHTAFEMCIRHATNLSCVSQYQGMTYNWWKVDENKINIDRSGGITIHDKVNLWSKSTEFNESICVSPLLSEADVRALHEHFIHVQLNKIDAKIDKLVEEIDSMSDYISDGPTWPIGIPSYSKPPNRYQVPKWEFFTSDEIFKNEPNHNVHALIGDDKADVDEVVQSARDFIENKADEMEGTEMEFVKLQNGYRLFDAMRGMDYMVDLIYRNKVSPETFIRRVHLTRAIASTQLMHQVPYVKEDTDLTIVIPLGSSTTNINAEIGALNRLLSIYSRICQSTNIGETRQTRIVVTARNVDQSAIDSINNHLVDLSLRCKSSGTDTMLLLLKGDSHPMISVASLDEAINHFGHQMIYLLLSPHADIQREFLDRVRINTIKHFQVFFPMPFVEFNPQIVSASEQATKEMNANHNGDNKKQENEVDGINIDDILQSFNLNDQNSLSNLLHNNAFLKPNRALVVHKDQGHFDKSDYSIISLYGIDYMNARSKLDNKQLSLDLSLLFLNQSEIHLMRAIEPALRLRYYDRYCDPQLIDSDYARCLISRREGFATKSQLANLIFNHYHKNDNNANAFVQENNVFK